jgi:hypothetical protein
MLNKLHVAKKIRLLGVIVTSDDPYAPVCADVVNRYFIPKGLPIGVLKNQQNLKNHSRYTRQVAAEFPHKLQSYEKAQDATALYRKLLSGSPDSSVVIITIGHLTNFQNLLKSSGDRYSKLAGKELAHKKVAKWLCMGGQFPEGKEANFYRPDPGSTVYSLDAWNKQVVFAGWEVGEKIKTGTDYLKSKLNQNSPVFRAYQLYNDFKGRASWDQVAVVFLVPEFARFFQTVTTGYCKVFEDGSNKWLTDKDSLHEYVQFKPGANYEEIARMMDDMVMK